MNIDRLENTIRKVAEKNVLLRVGNSPLQYVCSYITFKIDAYIKSFLFYGGYLSIKLFAFCILVNKYRCIPVFDKYFLKDAKFVIDDNGTANPSHLYNEGCN